MSDVDNCLKILSYAKKELGVNEKNNPNRIIQYQLAAGLEANSPILPWCASFLNFILDQAGFVGTGSPAARSFLEWGREIKEPIVGCIVVLKRGDNPKYGHVTQFNNLAGNLINCYGGNQHKSVCFANYLAKNLLSYRVPE